MVGYKDTSDVAKKAFEVAQKKEQQLAIWWDNSLDGGMASKPKAKNPKQHF